MNRREVWKVKENICIACGKELEESKFEIYHRDGDDSNEDIDNLDLLCKECHDAMDKNSRGETEVLLQEIEEDMPDASPEVKSLEFLRRIKD